MLLEAPPLPTQPFTLRPYQQRAITEARAAMKAGKRKILIVQPTGENAGQIQRKPRLAPIFENGYVLMHLGDEFWTKLDLEDYELVSQFAWCVKGRGEAKKYAVHATSARERDAMPWLGKSVRLHRFLFAGTAEGFEIDHINGDSLDNRRCNLRACTRQENAKNSKGQVGMTGFRGVSYDGRPASQKKPFKAKISHQDRTINLGSFATAVEAARAYDTHARSLNGDFAITNEGLGLL